VGRNHPGSRSGFPDLSADMGLQPERNVRWLLRGKGSRRRRQSDYAHDEAEDTDWFQKGKSCSHRSTLLSKRLIAAEESPQAGTDGNHPLAAVRGASDLRMLHNFERVVHLHPEIAQRRFQLGVSKQELHGPQILRLPVDQGRL
jgi:hypothetical protein